MHVWQLLDTHLRAGGGRGWCRGAVLQRKKPGCCSHLGRPCKVEAGPLVGGNLVAGVGAAGEGVRDAEGRVERAPHRLAELVHCRLVHQSICSLRASTCVHCSLIIHMPGSRTCTYST